MPRANVSGVRFGLAVRVPAEGRLEAAGTGVKAVHVSAKRAGTYRLTLALTAKARKALEAKGKLRLTVEVRYTAARGSSWAMVSIAVRA